MTDQVKAEAWDQVVAEVAKGHQTSTGLGQTVRRMVEAYLAGTEVVTPPLRRSAP